MLLANMVELRGIEPRTLCLQSRCSPSWAIAPEKQYRVVSGEGKEKRQDYVILATRTSHLATGMWWVWVDLNHRPHPYQGCALTNWATDPVKNRDEVPGTRYEGINTKQFVSVKKYSSSLATCPSLLDLSTAVSVLSSIDDINVLSIGSD